MQVGYDVPKLRSMHTRSKWEDYEARCVTGYIMSCKLCLRSWVGL